MVALPKVVNVAEQASQGGNSVHIPSGNYQAVIVGSEMKENKKKTGSFIELKIVITQGEHKDTEFNELLNVINENPKAVEIAYQTIANIGKAIGLETVNNTDQLNNKPFMITVKSEKQDDWVNNDGETVEGKEKSVIKKYLPIPSGGVPAQTSDLAKEEAKPSNDAPVTNPFAAA